MLDSSVTVETAASLDCDSPGLADTGEIFTQLDGHYLGPSGFSVGDGTIAGERHPQ